MNLGEKSLRIIGNESNHIYEMEPGNSTPAPEKTTIEEEDKSNDPSLWNNVPATTQQPSNDLATNDGAVIETLDTAFHNKPGVAEGTNPSGSNRADYYEAQADGQSDAVEEVNPSSA
jgi:hypothetical protein